MAAEAAVTRMLQGGLGGFGRQAQRIVRAARPLIEFFAGRERRHILQVIDIKGRYDPENIPRRPLVGRRRGRGRVFNSERSETEKGYAVWLPYFALRRRRLQCLIR